MCIFFHATRFGVPRLLSMNSLRWLAGALLTVCLSACVTSTPLKYMARMVDALTELSSESSPGLGTGNETSKRYELKPRAAVTNESARLASGQNPR